jgi:hypothetical protein
MMYDENRTNNLMFSQSYQFHVATVCFNVSLAWYFFTSGDFASVIPDRY